MIKSPPNVMTFSATDPTCGAGLQADILTISSLGCQPVSITTGVTVQDTIGVNKLIPIDSELVNNQARLILEDMNVEIFKLGLLGSKENIATIAEIISDYPDIPLIIDPVLASGRGDELVDTESRKMMMELLFPESLLITPNSIEARQLVNNGTEGLDLSIETCVDRFKGMGCENILITGSHEDTENVVNTLYGTANQIIPYYWDRLPGSYHGSGCTLTSAISAYYALGLSIGEAVEEAQYFTWHALKNGFKPGKGQLIPNRLFQVNDTEDDGKSTYH
ncbi:hydroxymethylpyrimidine/phosphomethylpyrimidine kinase [Methylophilaceae bacterium]|jgi:hydroxymethylpyrimidine/phosphomethylpyrimidine kinase|nr:hydroxymethylpyrimidine/phosphomethylpyrimidine kinase [Methylophilaceae bacterium]|tara:strand:+ start:2281 stop:3114 length:834 start_codon:yes stop_codon:yes gene_type:complete